MPTSEIVPDAGQEDETYASGSMISAHSVLVSGGTFNLHNSRVQAPVMEHGRAIREFFEDHVMLDATYEAKNNDVYFPESRPNEDMDDLLTSLLEWSQDPATAQNILYVFGQTGTRRRSFAMSLARILDDKGLLGASFFFRQAEQHQEQKFVATLALQLMTAVPILQPSVLAAINTDPFIFHKLSQKQVDQLIVRPIMSCDFDFPTRIVIIEGLEKYETPEVRCRALSLMVNLERRVDGKLKFIILGSGLLSEDDTLWRVVDGRPLDGTPSEIPGESDVPFFTSSRLDRYFHLGELHGSSGKSFLILQLLHSSDRPREAPAKACPPKSPKIALKSASFLLSNPPIRTEVARVLPNIEIFSFACGLALSVMFSPYKPIYMS